METFVFVTNNQHKLEEAKAMLKNKIDIVGLSGIGCYEDIPETGKTLKENALQKAHFIYDNYHYNCFADDTGLEVEALDGAPGVYSARYAGESSNSEANIAKLLANLEGKTNRKARFRTVVALLYNGNEFLFEGTVNGHIISERKGVNGFGYDPVFIPNGYNQTFAEQPAAIKNAISHRAKAMVQLYEFLTKNKKTTIQ
ncbi:MAG TPA: non-canonical purine NTP diphosphatase [Paludibacteraceae bacterium]|mgnify:FL=1|nr:non-canonical purine NTP diphosphatase [Paludibacteraceae bacterium]